MSDTLPLDAASGAIPAPTPADRPPFQVVSPRKFAILYLATFGMYAVLWFYKSWDNYRKAVPRAAGEGSIWPLPRALFAIFFVHSLFGAVKAQGDAPVLRSWPASRDAWLVIGVWLVSALFDRLSAWTGAPMYAYASFAMSIPMLLVLLRPVSMMNLVCGDPTGASNDAFSAANRAWTILGAIVWLAVFLGWFGAGGADYPAF